MTPSPGQAIKNLYVLSFASGFLQVPRCRAENKKYMVRKKNKFNREKYLQYLISSDWLIKKSKLVMTYLEMGWALQCEHCGSKYNLQCHHLSYHNLYQEKVEDLTFLCKECHQRSYSDKKNFDRESDEQFFELINNPNWDESLVGLPEKKKNKKYGK